MDLPSAVHLDAQQLSSLAQPLRVRLLGALRLDGPSTATRLAERLSSDSGKTSYHLRRLAAVGLVAEAPELGDDRDRWWRAAHDVTIWHPEEFIDDPDADAAARWLMGQMARGYAEQVEHWLATRDDWSDAWAGAADMSDLRISLTPDALRELNDELLEVARRHLLRAGGGTDSRDVVPCTVIIQGFPNPNPVL